MDIAGQRLTLHVIRHLKVCCEGMINGNTYKNLDLSGLAWPRGLTNYSSFVCWVKSLGQISWSRLLAEVWVWIPMEATWFYASLWVHSAVDVTLLSDTNICLIWGANNVLPFQVKGLFMIILDSCWDKETFTRGKQLTCKSKNMYIETEANKNFGKISILIQFFF